MSSKYDDTHFMLHLKTSIKPSNVKKKIKNKNTIAKAQISVVRMTAVAILVVIEFR